MHHPLSTPQLTLRLGARIASLHWQSRLHTILQILAFMLTTPIGIAIGIGVRQSFSANGTAALVSIGILDSTSAGILVSPVHALPMHAANAISSTHPSNSSCRTLSTAR